MGKVATGQRDHRKQIDELMEVQEMRWVAVQGIRWMDKLMVVHEIR